MYAVPAVASHNLQTGHSRSRMNAQNATAIVTHATNSVAPATTVASPPVAPAPVAVAHVAGRALVLHWATRLACCQGVHNAPTRMHHAKTWLTAKKYYCWLCAQL